MSDARKPTALTGAAAEARMRLLSRRSFATGAVAAMAGLAGWGWLTTAAPDDGIPWPLRGMLRFNQWLAEGVASPYGLAPTFPRAAAHGPPRTNGLIGLSSEIETAGWQLRVEHSGRPQQCIPLTAVQHLSRTDLVTDLRCVEGWSEVMHCGGVRLIDLLTAFGLGTHSGRAPDPAGNPDDLFRYVYVATPDQAYYVGLDMASALHPQTLLCDTMNGRPLTREHGAPLRLYLTVKYGYKSLKRVGLIRFQDDRPPDYWAENGYDWYAGL
jgi:DMSO/TMAO reductase YedYZ molybdopterin-dependent catalytic subunit